MLASATPTLTETATALPTDTAPPAPTQPPAEMATDTAVPTATLPPTLPPPPPTATPLPSPTPQPSSFTVTIRNNQNFEIYAFRDGQLMGTDPIPPAHYIYYRGIPPGSHEFTFCADMERNYCPVVKHVVVNQDMTIAVP
jgi:hypothetical protein